MMPVERVMGPNQNNMKNYGDLQPYAEILGVPKQVHNFA